MRFAVPIFIFLFSINAFAQTAKDFAADWDKQHFSRIAPSNLRHADLKHQLDELKKLNLKIEEVGKSYASREIYQIEWGKGKTKIFMWSQMHGDEPTATPALLDLFVYLQKNRDKTWVKELENALTIRAVPMLNPDGTELFQRRNLQFIDINRDAAALETPEGRLLKKLRDEWTPDIGFNLHNQNALTTVGGTNRQATVSFLAVLGNAEGKPNAGFERGKRLCAVMISALENYIKGHIAKYDDSYNPRAFGDMISAWGTPVVLIETGALHGKDEMFLVKLNFVAYLAALQSLVDKTELKADSKIYDALPFNDSGNLFSVIFRHASVVNFSENVEPFAADIALNSERRRASEIAASVVSEIGDLGIFSGLDEYDASAFYLIRKDGLLKTGASGEMLFYKKTREIDWTAEKLAEKFPPDAVFSNGKWTKGILPKQNLK